MREQSSEDERRTAGATPRTGPRWQFWVDVGGTFTDCIARAPDGAVRRLKVLSSSVIRGEPGPGSTPAEIVDPKREGAPEDFFRGFLARLVDGEGRTLEERAVIGSSARRGSLVLDRPWHELARAVAVDLVSPEEAPLLAIRTVLGLRLDEEVPTLDLILGTTRGTNALLERRGARTGLVITAGFADLLRIAYQDRPDLFALAIELPPPLWREVLEVEERVSADGRVLEKLDTDSVRRGLERLKRSDVDSLAVCLLHSPRRPDHEERVAAIAREVGFERVTLSSASAATRRFVPRGDTALVDAYLGPILERYIERISARAPNLHLRLLTSAGGLASPASFRGRDSILSGPAGGAVGVANIAAAHGCRRAIGFDMGGTSTDVTRWDGAFEMQYETRKAGVRIATPMLAIETVAAGGGSICGFDGERLTVGPESAGADPGPACYGAGGPLTVADLDLFLGRVPEDHFPFPLHRRAVERRLDELRERLSSRGHDRTRLEVAAGLLSIATRRVVGAIRRVSVSRGYDVRTYTLVAFGGAGAQHACRVACELGMREIIVPRSAGLFSAYGAGVADVRKFVERAVFEPFDDDRQASARPMLDALEADARAAVTREGVRPEEVRTERRLLALRYRGQDSSIEVPDSEADLRGAFEREHRRFYGYIHRDRPIELTMLRAECAGPGPGREALERAGGAEAPAPGRPVSSRRAAVFGEEEIEVDVIGEEALAEGRARDGPLIVLAPFHTVVVDPGWSISKLPRGDLVLTSRVDPTEPGPATVRGASRQTSAGEPADPVLLEIFHQHFASIAEEMGVILRRSALSTNVRERLDFSCAVFDRAGRLVANAPHIPVHLGAMGACVEAVLEDLPGLGPGDVAVTNDPYRGGSHLPDVTVVAPVFDDENRERLFLVASRAHHAEIGGRQPGSMPPNSHSLEEEGVLLPAFRVVERGDPHLEELRERLTTGPFPSRAPDENVADVEAQIAACARGAALLRSLVAEHGSDVVLAYMDHIQRASSSLVERRLAELPRGERTFEDSLDDGTPIRVTVTLAGGRACFDFAGSGPVHPGNLNATPAIVASAVIYCLRLLLPGDLPLNAGVLDPVEIRIPEGVLSPPWRAAASERAAVSGGNVETSQRIVDVVLGALGVAAASQGTMNNVLFGNERFGYYETIAGGAGAGPGFHGASAVHTHMTNTRLTDVEILEARYPVRVSRFEIRRGSGGAGRWRGGDGVVRELEFLEPVEVSIVSQRRTRAPFGAEGGEPGRPGRNLLRRGSATTDLPGIASFLAQPGDVLRIETPGGGGWGR